MIDYIQSAELNNMSVDETKAWFERYPGSSRRIIAVCDGCNKERNTSFDYYRDLCVACSRIKHFVDNPEAREAVRLKTIKQFSDPKAREAAQLKSLKQFSDPKARKKASDSQKKRFGNSKEREKISNALKNYNNVHPEAGKLHSEWMIEHDIVRHHYIYDHAHPENHITRITRSQHAAHHQWMIRNGLKVPHINIKGVL